MTPRHRHITLTLLLADGSHRTSSWTHVLSSPNDARLAMKAQLDFHPKPAVVGAVLTIGADVYQYGADEVAEQASKAQSKR
jgi:hypothetical protein